MAIGTQYMWWFLWVKLYSNEDHCASRPMNKMEFQKEKLKNQTNRFQYHITAFSTVRKIVYNHKRNSQIKQTFLVETNKI